MYCPKGESTLRLKEYCQRVCASEDISGGVGVGQPSDNGQYLGIYDASYLDFLLAIQIGTRQCIENKALFWQNGHGAYRRFGCLGVGNHRQIAYFLDGGQGYQDRLVQSEHG